MIEKIKRVLRRCWNYMLNRAPGFDGHYDEWREKRIAAILKHYGRDHFRGISLLEVGSGYSDIGAAFSAIGAKVTCWEGREANVSEARKRYPKLNIEKVDIDCNWPAKNFNFLIHMGVLYHLSDYEKALKDACHCAPEMVLETEVCDSDDPDFALSVAEEKSSYDQALHGCGIRPSPASIERVLKGCGMEFERISDSRCNSGFHVYDWPVTNTKSWRSGLRAMWFVRRSNS